LPKYSKYGHVLALASKPAVRIGFLLQIGFAQYFELLHVLFIHMITERLDLGGQRGCDISSLYAPLDAKSQEVGSETGKPAYQTACHGPGELSERIECHTLVF
jgi:hypothetical protein